MGVKVIKNRQFFKKQFIQFPILKTKIVILNFFKIPS